MATVCELAAAFDSPLTHLYEMFRENVRTAVRWGTNWDIVREEIFRRADGANVRQVWGFSSAYARMDGMGGHVSFWAQLVELDGETEVTVTVSSPYEKRGENTSHYRRAHQVALRLLEFCVAPYEEIHPRINKLMRLAETLRTSPTEVHTDAHS
jgi:hypothetical protein